MTIKPLLKKLIKGYLRDIWWYFYGKSFKNPRLSTNPVSLMFICKGNICRSPFAEHMAGQLSKEKQYLRDLVYDSAGLEVCIPEQSPFAAVSAAQVFGIDLKGHRSRLYDLHSTDRTDMIVVMEASQFKSVRTHYPNLRKKVFLLPLFEEKGKGKGYLKYNIPDPYGKNTEVFMECYQRITLALEKMLQAIQSGGQGRE